jgi:hypothetical protein
LVDVELLIYVSSIFVFTTSNQPHPDTHDPGAAIKNKSVPV